MVIEYYSDEAKCKADWKRKEKYWITASILILNCGKTSKLHTGCLPIQFPSMNMTIKGFSKGLYMKKWISEMLRKSNQGNQSKYKIKSAEPLDFTGVSALHIAAGSGT